MAPGATGLGDLQFDLVSVQHHALTAGHDHGQYVRSAQDASLPEFAAYLRRLVAEDPRRAGECHRLLARLGTPTAHVS